ncbi:MAG TPA: hypothetical protein VMY77_16505, partial [Chitinophagaceae bacterium]|nr:hypothetical protein [Chitinophagaceae bacterium]
PLRSLKFKTPNALSEKYFVQSFDTIIYHYSANLKQLQHPALNLKDIDFDTGQPTAVCEYRLADETYDLWLLKLQANKFSDLTSPQKQNILNFYHWDNSSQNTMYIKKCLEVFTAYQQLQNTSLEK